MGQQVRKLKNWISARLVNEQLLKLSGVLVEPESDTSVNRGFGFFFDKGIFQKEKSIFYKKKAHFIGKKHISGEKSIY